MWFESAGLSLDRISQDSNRERRGERKASYHQLKYVFGNKIPQKQARARGSVKMS